MRSVLEMSFDAEVLATYLAALSELASLKEVILGLPTKSWRVALGL